MAKINENTAKNELLELTLRTEPGFREVELQAPEQSVGVRVFTVTAPDTAPNALRLPALPISDLTDEQLTTFEANYRKRNKTEGGVFNLEEILSEKNRRLAKQWNIPGLLRVILENRRLGDGLTAYKDLWNVMFPGKAWKGRYSVKIVMEALDVLNRYIIAEGLPLHTILVVNSATRTLRKKAIESLYFRARELGREVGPDVDAFVERERARALLN